MGESVPQEPGPATAFELRRTVVLIGMMGAGKTAIGRALAALLSVAMHDSDAEIVASAQLSIAEIFDRFGEAFFRDKEGQVIDRLLDGPPCILSTGGGAWMQEGNRTRLTERACVVWLEADLDLLWTRVRHKSHRPLLQTDDPFSTLSDILVERTPVYALAPRRVTVAPDWSIDQTASAVMNVLRQAGAIAPRATTVSSGGNP